jgi:hypothetical protein
VENFNAFIPVYYKPRVNDRYKDIVYAHKNNLLTIRIVPEKRVFSVPFQKILPELRAMDEKRGSHMLDKDKPLFFQNDDYILWVNGFEGHYYITADTVSITEFIGYLFYNK